jgi:prophage antirepressor-like protein
LENQIQKFVNNSFGEIRTVLIDGEPWFIAKDVCNILGHTNPTVAMNSLEDFEKAKFNLGLSGGCTNVINESGFYSLVIRSRKEIAKPFRLWVTRDVLPQIRKTGGYIPVDENDSDKQILAKALLIANNTITELQQFYDDLMNTDGLYSMNITAKELRIGRNILFSYLRDKGIMFYKDNSNIPYQRFMNQGLFKVIESPCPDGQYRPTTYVTKKGLEYIRKLLRKDGYYTEVA